MNKKEVKMSRRELFKTSTLVTMGGAIAYGLCGIPLLRSQELLLRPPGALDEDVFLSSCIKCGQCLQVCPPQVIDLAGLDQGFGIGTPYIIPREGACVLCKGLPCVLACPTGALDHAISEGKEAAMGLAVLSQPETCLSVKGINDLVYRLEKLISSGNPLDSRKLKNILSRFIGNLTLEEHAEWQATLGLAEFSLETFMKVLLENQQELSVLLEGITQSKQAETSCQVCLDECPIKEVQPIVFETRTDSASGSSHVYPVVQRTCVGCGVCEMKCPTLEPSITIVPRLKWEKRDV